MKRTTIIALLLLAALSDSVSGQASYTTSTLTGKLFKEVYLDTDQNGTSATLTEAIALQASTTPTLAIVTQAGASTSDRVTFTSGVTVAGDIRAHDSAGIGLLDDAGVLGLWIADGGKVGVGKNDPAFALDVQGQAQATTVSCSVLTVNGVATFEGIILDGNLSSWAQIIDGQNMEGVGLTIRNLGPADAKGIEFSGIIKDNTNYWLYMDDQCYWRADGQLVTTGPLGIGTDSPSEEVELHVSDAFAELLISSERDDDGESIGALRFEGRNDAGSPGEIKYAGIKGGINDNTAGGEIGELLFEVAPGDGGGLDAAMTIVGSGTTGGNVGIGTTPSGSYLLEVNGQMSSGLHYIASAQPRLFLMESDTSDTNWWLMNQDGTFYISTVNDGGVKIDHALNINNSTRNVTIYTDLLVSGDMGVGLTPAYRLDVKDDVADSYVASFFNDGNNQNRHGIRIQGGADDGSGSTYYLSCSDGDGDAGVGGLEHVAGTFQLYQASGEFILIQQGAELTTRTIKENLTTTTLDATEIARRLKVFDYDLKESGQRVLGQFTADQIEPIFPEMVGEHTYAKQLDTGTTVTTWIDSPTTPGLKIKHEEWVWDTEQVTRKVIYPLRLIPILLKAHQEQDARLTQQGARLTQQDARIAELERRSAEQQAMLESVLERLAALEEK